MMIKDIEYSEELKREKLDLAMRFLQNALSIFDELGYKCPERINFDKKDNVDE